MKWSITTLLLLCGCIIVYAPGWSIVQHDPHDAGYSPSSMPALKEVWVYEEYGKLRAYFVVSDEKLFVVQDFSLSALDINTGSVLWNTDLFVTFPSVPAVAHNIYVSASHALLCFDRNTGEMIWEYESWLLNVRSFPIVIGDYVFVGGGDTTHPSAWNPETIEALERAGEYARRVLCLHAGTGEVLWEFYARSTTPYSPAYFDGKIYINDGSKNVYCLDAQTGELIWEKTIEWTSFSSLSLDRKRIFVGTGDGIVCLERETGETLWKFDCGNMVFETPAVAYDNVFVGTPDGVFYCLNAENGDLIWKIKTQSRVSSSAVVADKKIAFGTGDGTLYIVKAESGTICESLQLGESGITVLALSDGKLFVGQENGRIYCFESSSNTLINSVFLPFEFSAIYLFMSLVAVSGIVLVWYIVKKR